MTKKLLWILLFAGITFSGMAQDDIAIKGQQAPAFSLMSGNKQLKSTELKGKIVLINFFATWCGPCRKELPELQEKVWKRFKNNPAFTLLVIGRQHNEEELKKFSETQKLELPFYPDPAREVYALFAKQLIPRNYILDKNGIIVYQSNGYDPMEFQKMIELLEKLLKE